MSLQEYVFFPLPPEPHPSLSLALHHSWLRFVDLLTPYKDGAFQLSELAFILFPTDLCRYNPFLLKLIDFVSEIGDFI